MQMQLLTGWKLCPNPRWGVGKPSEAAPSCLALVQVQGKSPATAVLLTSPGPYWIGAGLTTVVQGYSKGQVKTRVKAEGFSKGKYSWNRPHTLQLEPRWFR